MVPTIIIHGSDGEVMAPAGTPGTFIPGKRQNILVTDVSKDETIPLTVRMALVGMKISTIFTKKQLDIKEVPNGSRIAYASEVIDALTAAGKTEAAESLQIIAGNELDMYVFEPEIFQEA